MNKKNSKRIHFFNPVTIIIVSVLSSIIAFIANEYINYTLIILSFIILYITNKKFYPKLILVAIIMTTIIKLFGDYFYNLTFGGFILLILFLYLKLFPLYICFKTLELYSSSEISSSLRKLKAPWLVSLTISIFFRYLPEFKKQINDIRDGAKIRGITLSFLKPIRSFEYLVVPMIYKGLHISDAITGSMIVKGVTYKGPKTNYRNLNFLIQDYIILLIYILIFGGALWQKLS